MDSKGIFKRRFNGKPGAKQSRYPKRKVYCIIERDEYIYFPISAQYSPYFLHDDQYMESYLAGMPNFFGGNMEGRETIEEALMREIREESQGKIDLEIPAGALGAPVFADPAGTDYSEQNTYKFYVLKVENCIIRNFEWGGSDVIPLHPFKGREDELKKYCAQYEDSFLIRMDKGRFCDFINRLKALKGASEEEVHRLLGEFGIEAIATATSIVNWYDSHTSTAFANSTVM